MNFELKNSAKLQLALTKTELGNINKKEKFQICLNKHTFRPIFWRALNVELLM